MEKQEALALLNGVKSEAEWNSACDKIKAACGGYPDWWYSEVIQTGLLDKLLGPGASDMKITSFGDDGKSETTTIPSR